MIGKSPLVPDVLFILEQKRNPSISGKVIIYSTGVICNP
jgi:hypothetical protein